MRKKLAVLLCGVMCMTALSGCSSTELAYLKMGSDLMNTMSDCKVEGEMAAEIDFDALNKLEKSVAEATGVESDVVEKMNISGKKAVSVDYDMNMKLDTLEYDLSFDVIVGDKAYDLGKMYYSLEKGVYVSTDTLWGMYEIYGDLYQGDAEYIMSDAFARDLRDILSEERYIEMVPAQMLTGIDMGSSQQDLSGLAEAAFTFYQDVLDGFETGMIKEINGGYQIETDGRGAAQLLADLLHFVAENPAEIVDATEVYMAAVMDSVETGTPEETEQVKMQMAAMFEQARMYQNDFVTAADQMGYLLEGLLQDAKIGTLLDGFQYKATVKKAGGSYHSEEVYTVKHEDSLVCRVVTDSMLKKDDVQIFFPVRAMTVDELENKLAELENEKYNPVTGVSVTWGLYGDTQYADIYVQRSVAEGARFGSNFHWSELIVENGRAYLPLRLIAEVLGEEVGWENSTKTPFILKDGERIDMKGKLQDGRSFVGIRDFEKLGYTVTYISHKDEFDSFFDYKEVLIEK